MKKMIFVITILLLSLLFIACKGENVELDTTLDQDITDENLENSEEEHIIQIGAMDYPPFEYVEDGELKGPHVDIVKTALNRLNYTYEAKDYSWNRLLEYVESGEIDIW